MIIDLHCDTIEKAYDNKLKLNAESLAFNTKQAKKNLPHIQCLATFVHSKYAKGNNGVKRANKIIDNFFRIYNPEDIIIIKSKEEINNKELSKKIGAILTIENGTAISGDLENIKKFYNKGIRMMGIVWNDDNDLACGASTTNDTGLTELGKKYIKELENQNIIIDLSHSSKKTFWDTCRITNNPIVASHSCVQKLCNHPRNLDDEQIKQIAKKEGVIGICFCKPFITTKNTATVKDIVNHIDYITNLVGIDYISFGSDFDGLEKEHILQDIKGVNDYKLIINELILRGYKKEDIEKICYKNFLRVFNKVLK
ncbi:MAG: dipeptidase [Clostridia bacterium]|nr:dipeptidase [Clostridia bacterium]